MRSLARGGLPWLTPGIVFLLLIDLFPLAYAVVISLYSWWLVRPSETHLVWLQNYLALARDPQLVHDTIVSATFMAGAVSLELIAGLLLAVVFAQRARIFDLVRPVILLPLFITPVVSGTMWRLMFHPDLGIVNYYLRRIGMEGPPWLSDPGLAMVALVLLDAWRTIPFMFLVLHAGIVSQPPEFFEAAMVDGASPWQMFWHITLPLLRYIMVVAVLIRAMDAFREFDIFYVLTSGGPGTATETIQMLNYRIFGFGRVGLASALSTLTLVLVAGMSLVLLRLLARESAT
ncbi:MAG TPA: sugar ABC transporter permease [bacterium]|nr:sugar ABC transporter permease [bacterium]